jgi:hypothetical protein
MALTDEQKAYERARHKKRKESDPDYLKKMAERSKRSYEKRRNDPAFAEKMRNYTRNRLAKLREADPDFRKRDSQRKSEDHQKNRLICLSHYGKEGKAQCCWPGCTVKNLDALELDHINDDGKQHREQFRETHGYIFNPYSWAIANNFPPIFQTLCRTHNREKYYAVRSRVASP